MGSLKAFGQQKPIVVNKENVVIAGNGTLAAAKKLGWKKIGVIISDLDPKNQKAYALADNRSAELAEWDDKQLGESLHDLFEDGFDIGSIGFELPQMDDPEKDAIEDDVPEVPQNIHNVQRGQIWKLGEHRLMCGDSTSKEDVERLMDGEKADLWLTDPPYGVAYKGKTKEALEIENDAMPLDEMAEFWTKLADSAFDYTTNQAPYYWFACQGGDQMMMMMMMSIGRANWKVRHELIWVKDSLVMSRCDYHYRHEPILYGWKQKGTHKFYGDRKQTSVIEFDRPKKNDVHPTMKPIELLEYLLKNSSESGNKILDTCLGSGSTLIACEKTNRKCYGMEIDPHYCSVIIERWQNYTGKKAELLTEPSPHVFPNGDTACV